jgi:hypothetical protein
MAILLRPGRRAKLFILLSILAVVIPGAPSFASKSSSDEDIKPSVEQFRYPIPEGKYVYQFSWNGIPSAESELLVTVENKDKQPYYCFEGSARTSKFVDIFWKLRANAIALVDVLTGRTLKISINDQQNAKVNRTETVFNYDSSEAYYTRWKKGEMKRKTIRLENGTIDPASLCVLISQREMQVGDSMNLTLLLGDDSYDVRYTVAAQESIVVSGCRFDALRIEPSFVKVGDTGKKKPPRINLMTLWIQDSEPRIPLRMKSKTFIGSVTAELISVLPA